MCLVKMSMLWFRFSGVLIVWNLSSFVSSVSSCCVKCGHDVCL